MLLLFVAVAVRKHLEALNQAVHVLNKDAEPREPTVESLLFLRQFAFTRLFERSETVPMYGGNTLKSLVGK